MELEFGRDRFDLNILGSEIQSVLNRILDISIVDMFGQETMHFRMPDRKAYELGDKLSLLTNIAEKNDLGQLDKATIEIPANQCIRYTIVVESKEEDEYEISIVETNMVNKTHRDLHYITSADDVNFASLCDFLYGNFCINNTNGYDYSMHYYYDHLDEFF